MSKFIELTPKEVGLNPFSAIGDQWMLITAGGAAGLNTMTASWGGMGVLWNVPVCFAFVRPNRYTYEFIEREKYFSLSFFDPGYRHALSLCGQKSGRDCDKIAEAGLTPVFDSMAPYFEESTLSVVCKKMYYQDLDSAHFLDEAISGNYVDGPLHRVYIGEVTSILKRIG